MSSIRKPSSERPSTGARQYSIQIGSVQEERDPTFSNILQANVQHSIVQSPAHQKLQAQVIDSLWISKGLSLLCTVPLGDQAVSEGQTGGSICSGLVTIEHAPGEGSFDMSNDLLLEFILALEGVGLELLPGSSLGLRDGSYGSELY
jgi:hypothetical protein